MEALGGGYLAHQHSSIRRVALASFIGTAIEWYDFYLYGTAAALVFPKLFFPRFNPAAGTLASFATFGVAFFAVPQFYIRATQHHSCGRQSSPEYGIRRLAFRRHFDTPTGMMVAGHKTPTRRGHVPVCGEMPVPHDGSQTEWSLPSSSSDSDLLRSLDHRPPAGMDLTCGCSPPCSGPQSTVSVLRTMPRLLLG